MDAKEVILKIVELVLFVLGMPVTQFLKLKLKLADRWALILTGAVAVVLAFVQVFMNGDLSLASFTLDNFAASFGVIFAVASFWYRLFVKPKTA